MIRLTTRRLRAVAEALTARLAGEIDIDGPGAPRIEDYKAALAWAEQQLLQREPKGK